MSNKVSLSSAQILAWGSVLLGFGLVQGVIYLKSYWGRFRLDPFQFGDASGLALVGMTGVGITIAMMFIAALIGSSLGKAIGSYLEEREVLAALVVCAVAVLLTVLCVYVDFGGYLVVGILATWISIWMACRSPRILKVIGDAEFLPYVAFSIFYVSLGAHYIGKREANDVVMGRKGILLVAPSDELRGHNFAGRIGDVYVFFNPTDGGVSLVQSSEVGRLVLKTRK
ncbi:MAG: hypothetical protein ACN6O2_09745 [Stenotrophomonas sp.]